VCLAIFLPPAPVKPPAICHEHAVLHADGSMEFGGVAFSNPEGFKARLVSYKKKIQTVFPV
jgi:hypothetical protein